MNKYDECIKYLNDNKIKYIVDDTSKTIKASCKKHQDCDVILATSNHILNKIKIHNNHIMFIFCVVKRYKKSSYVLYDDVITNIPYIIKCILNNEIKTTCCVCSESNKDNCISCWCCCAYICKECKNHMYEVAPHPYYSPNSAIQCPVCQMYILDYRIFGEPWDETTYLEVDTTHNAVGQFTDILYNLDGCMVILVIYDIPKKEFFKARICHDDENNYYTKAHIFDVELELNKLCKKHNVIDITMVRNISRYDTQHKMMVNEVSCLQINNNKLISFPTDSYILSKNNIIQDEYHMNVSYIEPCVLKFPKYFKKQFAKYNKLHQCDKLICIHNNKSHNVFKYIYNDNHFLPSDNRFIRLFDEIKQSPNTIWIIFGNLSYNNQTDIDVEIFDVTFGDNKEIMEDNSETRNMMEDIFKTYGDNIGCDNVRVKKII